LKIGILPIGVACAVAGVTVQLRWLAMDSRRNLLPHPLERAVPADPGRASEVTGMPVDVDGTLLGKVRRGGNDSRHLLYFGDTPDDVVSVFVTGRRYDGVVPSSEWTPEDIGLGRLVYARVLAPNRAAVCWVHGDRRCVAVGDRPVSAMLRWVRSASAQRPRY
jgi:hypothetical protein